MKHRYRFLFMGIVILILIISQQIQITTPINQHPENNQSSITGQRFDTITGILLTWPKWSNRNKRSQTIGQNTYFLYGWIYDITYTSAINRLNTQPFPITFIVENQKYQQYGDDFKNLDNKLSDDHISLLKDQKLWINLTHAKTFVGDTRRVIQTANLNRSSFVDNREHFFLSQDPTIRDNLIALFKLDTKKIADPKSVTIENYKKLIDENSPNLLICPLNCRSTIESVLNNATSRIRISAQYIIDKNIINILKKKRNLDIRILTNNMDSNRDLIRALGQDRIRFEDSRQYNHDKLLLIDDILIIGSMNLSDNALDNNREIGIVLTDPSFIQQIEPLFKK